jgi:putative salt-induced outer membrane protein YdiY
LQRALAALKFAPSPQGTILPDGSQQKETTMKKSARSGCVAGIMTIWAGGLQADIVHLDDGTRLVGTIEQIAGAEAILSNTFAGELRVPRDRIVSIETEAPVTVQLTDGAYLTGTLGADDTGTLMLQVDRTGSRAVALADVQGIYREDPQTLERRRLAVVVSGDANVGLSFTSGNTDTENLHVDGRVITRTPKNRYTLSGEFNQEESEGIKVQENWNSLVKYDHFVSDRWYWFNSASFESDEFKDLDLRAAIAAGMGYQFFETDDRLLSVEAGPSYIDENFDVADDDSFFGARWAVSFEQRLWNGLWFYHNQEGLLGLESTDDLTIRARTGLRMNVTDRIIARIQTATDWDNSPPEGADSTDLEHTVTIGYRF